MNLIVNTGTFSFIKFSEPNISLNQIQLYYVNFLDNSITNIINFYNLDIYDDYYIYINKINGIIYLNKQNLTYFFFKSNKNCFCKIIRISLKFNHIKLSSSLLIENEYIFLFSFVFLLKSVIVYISSIYFYKSIFYILCFNSSFTCILKYNPFLSMFFINNIFPDLYHLQLYYHHNLRSIFILFGKILF